MISRCSQIHLGWLPHPGCHRPSGAAATGVFVARGKRQRASPTPSAAEHLPHQPPRPPSLGGPWHAAPRVATFWCDATADRHVVATARKEKTRSRSYFPHPPYPPTPQFPQGGNGGLLQSLSGAQHTPSLLAHSCGAPKNRGLAPRPP